MLQDSNDNNNTHESIIKSATVLDNTLFYEMSRVSGIKKSIELKIANTYILLDDKTEAQLIYYYNTGELLNDARIMLERSSVEIQERYKFFITSEKLEVSMPDIFESYKHKYYITFELAKHLKVHALHLRAVLSELLAYLPPHLKKKLKI